MVLLLTACASKEEVKTIKEDAQNEILSLSFDDYLKMLTVQMLHFMDGVAQTKQIIGLTIIYQIN